jgi:hypothetical protein
MAEINARIERASQLPLNDARRVIHVASLARG